MTSSPLSYVPPGTNVVIPFYALQRDPRNFSPLPNEWIPERWLDEAHRNKIEPQLSSSPEYKHDMKAFVAFSSGPANCVGKSLAMMEMRGVLCMLIKRFEMRLSNCEEIKRKFEKGMKDLWIMQTDDLWAEFWERKN
ncbi:hypothetical protein VNI00_010865 [Paramarasmius palmivorus]|uniref:Cytochrome P450 n=1 Tax=Paramarasmius palmivorus TaxID=297713 RepID=A0AAW0CDF8_9AGAR